MAYRYDYNFWLGMMNAKKRNRRHLKIMYGTHAKLREDGDIWIYHHYTHIITVKPNNTWVVDLHGYGWSYTTRGRINNFTPATVFRLKDSVGDRLVVWYGHGRRIYNYFPGMIVDESGNVLNSDQPEEEITRWWTRQGMKGECMIFAKFLVSLGWTNYTKVFGSSVEAYVPVTPRGKTEKGTYGFVKSSWQGSDELYSHYNSDLRAFKFLKVMKLLTGTGGKLEKEWIEYQLGDN